MTSLHVKDRADILLGSLRIGTVLERPSKILDDWFLMFLTYSLILLLFTVLIVATVIIYTCNISFPGNRGSGIVLSSLYFFSMHTLSPVFWAPHKIFIVYSKILLLHLVGELILCRRDSDIFRLNKFFTVEWFLNGDILSCIVYNI